MGDSFGTPGPSARPDTLPELRPPVRGETVSPTRRASVGPAGLGHSVVSVYFACLLSGASAATLPASGSILRARLGLSDAVYGACFLPGCASGILVALAGPLLMRRWSLRALYQWGVGLPAVALVLMAVSPAISRPFGLTLLLLAMGLLGVAGGLGGITLNTAAMGIFPTSPGGALAMLHAVLGAGAALWPMVIAGAAQWDAWRAAPLALAGAFLVLLAAARRREIHGLAAERRTVDGLTDVPVRLRWRAATILLYGIAEATFTAWAVIYLTEDRGLSLAAGAGALSLFWLMLTAGRALATMLVRSISPARIAFGLSLAMAVAFPIVARARGSFGSLAAFAFAGLACSASFPVLLGLSAGELPERKPQVSATFSAAVLIGLAIGSFGVGPLRALVPLERIYAVGGLVPVLMGALLLVVRRQPRSCSVA